MSLWMMMVMMMLLFTRLRKGLSYCILRCNEYMIYVPVDC